MKRPFVAIVLSLLMAGCVRASTSVLMDRSAHPVPQLEVQVLLSEDEVSETCERVALISAIGGLGSNQGQIWNKLREEAGKLGANAVLISDTEAPGLGSWLVDGTTNEGESVALWCPGAVQP